MKLKLFFFFAVIITWVITSFAQDDQEGIYQPKEKVEKTIWWDIEYIIDSTDTVYVFDGVADDAGTIANGDTFKVALYITPLTSDIGIIEIPLQYGYYHLYKPNSYYDGSLTFLSALFDTLSIGIDSVGVLQTLSSPVLKRYMFNYTDTSTANDINTDTLIAEFTFIAGPTDGRQIIGVPLSTDLVNPSGYTQRYYAEILRKNNIPFLTTVRNLVITVE